MNMPPTLPAAAVSASRPLAFVRHGATQPNLDGLRCGGDLDLPMTDLGRTQVAEAARQMRASGWRIDLIVASDLQRTRDSAHIVSEVLGGVPIEIDAAWRERALGRLNLRPIAETEHALRADHAPEEGESRAVFAARIEQQVQRLLARTRARLPLLVGSKGVARVLRELLDVRAAAPVGNGDMLCFDLTPLIGSPAIAGPQHHGLPRAPGLHRSPMEVLP